MDEKALKELLIKENEEFKSLFDEHQRCEKRLEEFKGKSFLTDDEVMEEKELKKKKLALKDRMYLMMTEYKKPL